MMALPLVTLHLALPRLPLSCVAYLIHSFANTASAYEPRSTCIAPWLSPSCSMALKHGPRDHPRRRLDVFDLRCQRRLLRVFWQQPVFHEACFGAVSAPTLYAPYPRRVRPYPARIKPGVHTNDFAPIHRLRALKLGHASLATVFRPGRLTLQPILRENLESPVLRYQPITTAVVTDACLNTRWHHGAYTSAVLRESLGLDRVVTVYGA